MGANYYHETAICEACGACTREHIGKASAGWTFNFQGLEEIRSWQDWRQRLAAGGRIVDEYGDEHTLADFEAMVERKRSEPHHHAREYPPGSWTDAEGHSFTGGDFS